MLRPSGKKQSFAVCFVHKGMEMKIAAVATFTLAAFAFMGHEDSKELDRQLAEYCEAVKSKQWPDFKGIYDQECK